MINDDKTFYHKALVWSAFFVLGDKTTCYCLSSLRNISSPYFTLNRNFGAASRNKLLLHNSCKLNYYHPICSIIVVNRTFMSTLQPKTNRCNLDSPLIKLGRPLDDLYWIFTLVARGHLDEIQECHPLGNQAHDRWHRAWKNVSHALFLF